VNLYRRRILTLLHSLLEPYLPLASALDFGSGDGWFARSVHENGIATKIRPVDVQRRLRCVTEPQLYDGRRLPFADRSFELVYSIDVLHHCPDPRASLRDALRCAGRYFLLKDHTYRTLGGRLTLCLLDEIGNRRFGVPSLYKYQHRWEWSGWIEAEGFVLERLVHPAACHTGPLGWATNALQFIALWRRQGSSSP
jgi:SAM-dependent methyltransferase